MVLGERKYLLIILGLIFLYIAILGSVSLLRHYNFQTQTWDMGIFVQTFWNLSQGNGPVNTVEEITNHFGVHASPIIYVLLPGFMLFPSAYYLLLIQTLALALGALFLYLFSKKILQRHDFPLLISAGYLLYPALHWVNLFDFHPIAFLVPALLGAFYFFYEARWLWFWLFIILAVFTQEDAILAVMFAGFFLAFIHWREAKERRIALLASTLAFIYFIVSIKILMPYFGGGLLRLDRYAHLGESFYEIARNLLFNPALFFKTAFSAPKLLYFLWLFLPVLFLPFFYLSSLLLLFPGFLENLLTNFANQFSGFFQYDSMLIAGLFIAVIYGLQKILSRWPNRARLFRGVLAVAILGSFLARSPISPFYFPLESFKFNERREVLNQIVQSIPANASVSAQTNIVPHIANREHIYMLGFEPFRPDFVIVDGGDFFGFYNPENLQRYADGYALSGEYEITVINERYFIFRKKVSAPKP